MLLRAELQDKDFYRKSLSLFMKNTPGIVARCDMWTDILLNVVNCGENLLELLDIFYYNSEDGNYLTKFGYDYNSTDSNFLDEIAAIYGVSRQIVMPQLYVNHEAVTTTPAITQVTLTNEELLTLIQATIMKYNFNGTRLAIREIYQGTPVFMWQRYQSDYPQPIQDYLNHVMKESFLTKLGIIYLDSSESRAECIIALTADKDSLSDNMLNLFANGLLTIESMGISYTYVDSALFRIATFDTAKYYDKNAAVHFVFAKEA